MASTIEIYKGPVKLGSGSASDGSATISSFTSAVAAPYSVIGRNRFVCVLVTQAGTHVGRSWWTRVIADNGSNQLTLRDPCPYVGA